MPLSLQCRQVGDITVITCSGRIVEGNESATLRQRVIDVLVEQRYLVLNLGEVTFVDSGGLGLLVRVRARTQAAHGDLKLCAVSPHLAEVLRVTRLQTIFESYATDADAVEAFYQPSTSASPVDRFATDILFVESSDDVLAYMRQVLGQAGYGVLTANNLSDALVLLRATRPKVVIVGASLHAALEPRVAEVFHHTAEQPAVITLPLDFSGHDAGEAGVDVLDQVRAVVGLGTASLPDPQGRLLR